MDGLGGDRPTARVDVLTPRILLGGQPSMTNVLNRVRTNALDNARGVKPPADTFLPIPQDRSRGVAFSTKCWGQRGTNASLLCCLPIAHTVLNVHCTQCMRAFDPQVRIVRTYTHKRGNECASPVGPVPQTKTLMRPNPMDFGCRAPAIPVHSRRISVRD